MTDKSTWTTDDIEDQTGRTFVITGANSGIGAQTARALAAAGATVVLACRDLVKGEAAAETMPGNTQVRSLDLSDLDSVRAFVARLQADGPARIDVLINNAGVMGIPLRRTVDGFEMQIGTNHLGHFALTGLLLDSISDRVVTISSGAHRFGQLNLRDLNWERRRYHRWGAYGQSKLANLLFTFELQRRLAASGSGVKAMAAHPGYAATGLQSHTESFQDKVMGLGNRFFAQSAAMGALPTLYAATTADLPGGSYAGPDGFGEQRGHPRLVTSSKKSQDAGLARGLWDVSSSLTGVSFG